MHQLLVLTPTDKSPTPLATTKARDDCRTYRPEKRRVGLESTGERGIQRKQESEREKVSERDREKGVVDIFLQLV